VSDTSADDRAALHADALALAGGSMPGGWEPVASSRCSRVARNTGQLLYYKEFLPRNHVERLKRLLRSSRATRARRNGDALRKAGFDAPANLAWGKLPGQREYLITTTAPGQGVAHWLQHGLRSNGEAALAERRRLLRELGRFIGRLHAAGFIHGDLRPGNIIACREEGGFHFTLIDNERNRRAQPPPGRALLRNLMQLNMLPPAALSRTDRMRFFREWHREMDELSDAEAALLGTEAYHWAMLRLYDKGRL